MWLEKISRGQRLWNPTLAQKAAQGWGTRLLGGPAHLRRTLLTDHAQGQRNRRQSTDQRESQSGRLALIIVEPTGKQKADPSAQYYAGSGDEYDLGKSKLSFHHFSHLLAFPTAFSEEKKPSRSGLGLTASEP